MRYLHTMVRVADLEKALAFYCEGLGLEEVQRVDNPGGRFTLVFLSAPFGHLAYQVDDIYEACRRLMDHGVTINRPPRDGRMAFVRSPDGISIELLQKGAALVPAEPWTAMENIGAW